MPDPIPFPRRHRAPPTPIALPAVTPASARAQQLATMLAESGLLCWATELAEIAQEARRMERALDEIVRNACIEALTAERPVPFVPRRPE